VDDIQTGGNPENRTFADARELEREGKRFEVGQIATAAAGSAIAITGLVLLAVGLKRRQTANNAAWLVPHAGPRTAGLSFHTRF
jgi:hypothetical protein